MNDRRSRAGILVGLAAAVGAFGAAAMMSTATAPTAHADDFTDIIQAVEDDFGAGQAHFTEAVTDFGSSDPSGGLASLFDGLDDDLFSPESNIYLGTAEALENDPVSSALTFSVAPEADFATSLADAETYFSAGQNQFAAVAADLTGANYDGAAYAEILGFDYSFVIAPETLLEGAAASF